MTEEPADDELSERDGRASEGALVESQSYLVGRRLRIAAGVIIAVGILLRLAVVVRDADRLSVDVDGYLALSESLREFGEFGFTPSVPTAFRPPLYPIAIMPFGPLGRGLLNVVCGILSAVVATAIVIRVGESIRQSNCGILKSEVAGSSRVPSLALGGHGRRLKVDAPACAAIVTLLLCCFSPLSVYYTGYSMTELFCGVLLMLALWLFSPRKNSQQSDAPAVIMSASRAMAFGLLLGFACLARPTSYAVGVLWFVWIGGYAVLFARRGSGLGSLKRVLLAGLICIATVSPWIVRNWYTFGQPIAMTTHGGYTLLLGNNDAFYDEVVNGPGGTVWTSGQQRWVEQLNATMDEAGVYGELARDRYQKSLAIETIRRRPADFVAACVQRIRSFFNITPETTELPRVVLLATGTFYGIAWLGVVIGLFRIASHRAWSAVPVVLLPIAFAAVHTVYWTNTRMRLPVEPALFVISGIGWASVWSGFRWRRSSSPKSKAV